MVNAVSIRVIAKPNSFIISTSKEVVPENEPHESQHQQKPHAIDHFHRPLRYRTPSSSLAGVENKMTAVKRWNRQKIQKSDSQRQRRNQLHQPVETELGGLAGHVRYLARPAELAL